MRKSITLCLMAMALTVQAQQGGITPDVLKEIKSSYKPTASDKAIYNAMAGTSIAVLAKNQERLANFDTHFSDYVVSHGITDQQQSGRCWLFTGLNVLRAQMMAKYGLDEMEFSRLVTEDSLRVSLISSGSMGLFRLL